MLLITSHIGQPVTPPANLIPLREAIGFKSDFAYGRPHGLHAFSKRVA